MKRLLGALGVVALAAAFLASDAPARLHVTFRYLGVDPKLGRVTDRPPRDVSPGDVVDVRYTLRVPRGVAGTAFFTFRYTSRTRVVAGARLRFREGTVLARGAFGDSTSKVRFRVTGGTGVFRGSRGVLTGADASGDAARFVLSLR